MERRYGSAEGREGVRVFEGTRGGYEERGKFKAWGAEEWESAHTFRNYVEAYRSKWGETKCVSQADSTDNVNFFCRSPL